MTLEDFFTLTEMKDGLILPARVEELVAVMKKEKGCIVKNVSDAMRQWSTVASVIAATENKDCLDLFIRLDGLLFIDRWLKDAQTFSGDSSDFLIEESISALLHALHKLRIGNEKLFSSGIYLTVRDLLSHTSLNIQDKAKSFLGSLKPTSMSGEVKLDFDKAQAVSDDMSGKRLAVESDTPVSSSAISPNQRADVDQHVHQLVGNIAAPSGCCVIQQSEGVEAVAKEPDELAIHFSECDLKELNDKAEYSVRQEACSSERKSISDAPDAKQGIDVWREVSRLGSVLEVTNAETRTENLPNEFGKVEVNPASIMPKPAGGSLILAESHVIETDGNGGDRSTIKSMSADLPTIGTSTKADDKGVLMNCTVTLAQKTPSQGDENSANVAQDSPVDGIMLRKSQDLDNTFPQADNASFVDKSVECVKHDPSHLRGSRGFESSRSYKRVDVTSKTSAMDLEYGMVDALEVACLVAKEVERQVAEDYDEQFGSFSKKSSRGDALHLVGSPDSFNGKEDQHADGSPSNESPVEKTSVEDSSGEDEPSLDLDNVGAEQENDTGVVQSSQVTEAAPEAANSADKGTSEFDLNLEICSEAADNSVSNPVSIVSASKAVAVPGLPSPPLKFEGALGWKGSASTSAFRPASPRKPDGDRTLLNEEATNASRQGQAFVFDLNFAEDGSSAPPGESLVEPSPRRSEKLSFDLNLLSEDRDAPFSPSMKLSSARNFDLNDKPLNFSETSDLLPCLGPSSSHQVNSYGGSSNDSVISIMGAKVKQSTFLHQSPFSFFNCGRASEPVVDSNVARSGPPFPPSPLYSYNGIAVGPAMSFSPPVYGPGGSAAYMVDPRVMGAPPSTFHASFAHQPPYTTNTVGPLPGSNGISPFQPHLDFNPGFVIDRATNRVDAGGFRQLFPGQGRSASEVQLQPLFPGISGKRKEPEGGWEFHQPPPHL